MPLEKIACCQGGDRDFDYCLHQSVHEDACVYPAALIAGMARNTADRKDAGALSATGLLGCARFNQISPQYSYAESPADYYDRWRGTMAHAVVEDYLTDYPGTIVERRLRATIGEGSLTGKPDMVVPGWRGGDGLIIDYKTTNKRVTSIREPKPEHIQQVNIYAYLLEHGYYVDSGEAVDISVGFGRIIYIEMAGYKQFTFPLMNEEEREAMVEELVYENIDFAFPEDLAPVLPDDWRGNRHWRCTRCPLFDECGALAKKYPESAGMAIEFDGTTDDEPHATFEWSPD